MAYLTALKLNKGGFVAPLEHKQASIPTSPIRGTNSSLSIFGIEISKTASSYADFCKEMKDKEMEFITSLYTIRQE